MYITKPYRSQGFWDEFVPETKNPCWVIRVCSRELGIPDFCIELVNTEKSVSTSLSTLRTTHGTETFYVQFNEGMYLAS